jgi:ketosteroid isomerase-like protein
MVAPTRIPLYLAAFAVAACAPPQGEPSQEDMEADVAAVNAVREQEVAAIVSGEMNTAYLAADAVVMPPNEPSVSGIDAIDVWFRDFLAQFAAVSVNYTSSEITVSGDWAIEHYGGTLTVTPVGGGDSMEEVVKGIHVYRREADGSWKMVYDVWNSDAPLPEM